MRRPSKEEYAPYYEGYIKLVEGDDPLKIMEIQGVKTYELLSGLTEEQGNIRYADGKWSIKEVIGHVMDTERVMAYRALCFARGEKQKLPGFEQDDYAAAANFGRRRLHEIAAEFRLVRNSNLAMFKSFDEETVNNIGNANGKDTSVLAFMYIIAGHEIHHVNIIKEKYLKIT